jgi:outer membrane protein
MTGKRPVISKVLGVTGYYAAAAKEEELLRPIWDDIEKAIADVMKEGGFAALFDSKAVVLGGVDITDEVVKKIAATGGE